MPWSVPPGDAVNLLIDAVTSYLSKFFYHILSFHDSPLFLFLFVKIVQRYGFYLIFQNPLGKSFARKLN